MINQKFWAVINKSTKNIAKGIAYEYKIYSTREQARKMNICLHKKCAKNYEIASVLVVKEAAIW